MTRRSVPQVAPNEVHELAPALGWYSDHLLFDVIWNRPNLGRRDRSIVTVSLLITGSHFAQLSGHTRRALDHGIRPVELVEIITHLAFYAGWPNAMSALKVVREVFNERHIAIDEIDQTISDSVDLDRARVKGIAGFEQPFRQDPFTAALNDCTQAVLETDLWLRPDLSSRDRSICTVSAMIGSASWDQLREAVRNALEQGLTIAELCEVVSHCAFYAGYPKARRAAEILDPIGAAARI